MLDRTAVNTLKGDDRMRWVIAGWKGEGHAALEALPHGGSGNRGEGSKHMTDSIELVQSGAAAEANVLSVVTPVKASPHPSHPIHRTSSGWYVPVPRGGTKMGMMLCLARVARTEEVIWEP